MMQQSGLLLEQIETKIKPNLKEIYRLKTEGVNDKMMAKFLGMTGAQFQYALDNFQPLKDIYDNAMTMLCQKLSNVVINRALGTDGKVDKDGQEIGPDSNLAMRMLEKLDPRFKQTKDFTVTLRIEDVIREISDKRKNEAIEAEIHARETIEREDAR